MGQYANLAAACQQKNPAVTLRTHVSALFLPLSRQVIPLTVVFGPVMSREWETWVITNSRSQLRLRQPKRLPSIFYQFSYPHLRILPRVTSACNVCYGNFASSL